MLTKLQEQALKDALEILSYPHSDFVYSPEYPKVRDLINAVLYSSQQEVKRLPVPLQSARVTYRKAYRGYRMKYGSEKNLNAEGTFVLHNIPDCLWKSYASFSHTECMFTDALKFSVRLKGDFLKKGVFILTNKEFWERMNGR